MCLQLSVNAIASVPQAFYLLAAQPYSLCPPRHSIISICKIPPNLAILLDLPFAPAPISNFLLTPSPLPYSPPRPLLPVHPPRLQHSSPLPALASPSPPPRCPLLPVHPPLDHYLHLNQDMLQLLSFCSFTHLR